MIKKKRFAGFIFSFVGFVVGFVGAFCGISYFTLPSTENVNVGTDISMGDVINYGEDISVHFLELGNKYTGDCTYIKTKEADILIDCGSKSNSIPTVVEYLNNFVTDGILEYVIVTHAHQDHYAGFATTTKIDSIFDIFECKTIIDFALTNQKDTSTMFQNYQRELADEVAQGASHYTALDCINETNGAKSEYDLGSGVSMKILDSFYYQNTSSSENNYSVCTMFTSGDKNFLFTGDLEERGEEYLVNMNELPEVTLYKAGHHGSKTSSTAKLMQVIKPQNVCVCCCAGSSEYTTVDENQFPTQQFINNVAPYTEKIYVTTLCIDYKQNQFTSFNGNIVCLLKDNEFVIVCSNNNTILKDSDWFKQHRTWPST